MFKKNDLWISTFHGLANRLLRAHYVDADLPKIFKSSITTIKFNF
ncbi:hypothetical protein [Candidatus Blochmanniella pennsylvanica]|nr:hypothetical protein [Candidatus Blochmannia pennsylvanicus]